MIKRRYFLSTKCSKEDGSSSFSWCNVNYESWFPDPCKVFNDVIEDEKKAYKEKGLDPNNIQVIAFNRVT